jgi:hypothetical protein
MDPALIPIALMVTVMGGFTAALAWSQRVARKQHELALISAAQRLGIDFTPGTWRKSPLVHGRVGGQALWIDHYTVSAGKSSVTYLRFRILGADLPGDLTIKREGALSSMKKMILGEDHRCGDPEI